MIVKIARILLIIIVILVTAIYLPYFYWMALDVNIRAPFILYSPVIDDFVMRDFNQPDSTRHYNTKGDFFTREKYEELLPLFNYRQLMLDKKMPDSLRGIGIDVRKIQDNFLSLLYRPRTANSPQIQLYPLFESQSGRVRLEWPNELFRINERMEFINAAKNSINEQMSQKFTNALAVKGFIFPANIIAGNPNVRKPFDEGYFITDAEQKLFHIKMIESQPYCKKIELLQGLDIQSIFVRENRIHEFYGVIFSSTKEVYIIRYNDYKIIKLPIEKFDPKTDNLRILSNIFFVNVSITRENGITALALDRDYKLVDSYERTWETRYERTPGIIANYLFPFTIQLRNDNTTLVDLYVRFSDWSALFGIVFFVLLSILLLRLRKRHLATHWLDLLIVLVSGIFGFIAIQIFDKARMKA